MAVVSNLAKLSWRRVKRNAVIPLMKNIFLIVSLFLFISCDNGKNEFNPKSVALNNEAVDKLKVEDYQPALNLFDEAIQLDSSYYIAYNNKVTALVQLERYNDAIVTNKLSLNQKPDLAEGHLFLGMLLENEGDSIKAKESYKKAIQIFEERISKDKMVESNELNLSVAYLFIGEDEKAKTLFEKLKENKKYNETVNFFYKSNKEEIIKQLLHKN